MKVAGIIAEYNPFHKGHAYQIKKLKTEYGFTHVVVLLSGQFVQRGEPALFHKYLRTQMALSCGADLVLEMPTAFATGSAGYFASCGVSTLASLGIVDALCYGMEHPDFPLYAEICQVLANEPPAFQTLLQDFLSQGESFPAARAKALEAYFHTDLDLAGFLNAPNNILGIEYGVAKIKYAKDLALLPIQREGASYHADSLSTTFSSATALRKAYKEGTDIRSFLPEPIAPLLPVHPTLVTAESFFPMVQYLLCATDDLRVFADCNEDLAIRMKKGISTAENFDDFLRDVKCKSIPQTTIQRAYIHLLLQIKKEHLELGRQHHFALYGKVLGFQKNTPLLSAIQKNSRIPILCNIKSDSEKLPQALLPFFQQDCFATELYNLFLPEGEKINEFSSSPQIWKNKE